MKKVYLTILIVILLVISFVSAASIDIDRLKSMKVVYASKFTITPKNIEEDSWIYNYFDKNKINSGELEVTYGILELHYEPLNKEIGDFSPLDYYSFDEYYNNLKNANWYDEANPLTYFSISELQTYYKSRKETDLVIKKYQYDISKEGPVDIFFYLKITDGRTSIQLVAQAGSFNYFEGLKDSENYDVIKRHAGLYRIVFVNGEKFRVDDPKVILINEFDESGNIEAEKTSVNFLLESSFSKEELWDFLHRGTDKNLFKIKNVISAPDQIRTKSFSDTSDSIQRRIYYKYKYIFDKMDNFEEQALSVVQEKGHDYEYINTYKFPLIWIYPRQKDELEKKISMGK